METRISLSRAIRTNPVTAVVIAVAVALFAAVKIHELQFPDDAGNAYWRLGSISQSQDVAHPELFGPWELWDAQIWRIPVSAFHHADILHLLMNCAVLGYLGWLLHSRIGAFQYSVFFLMAILFSSMPGLLIEECAIGLSGVAYAIFGVLFVIRQHDVALRRFFPDWVVQIGFISLFLCLILTWYDIQPIANPAHFSGLIYGWLVGSVFYGPHQRSLRLRGAFFVAHLLLIPAVDMAVHPVWIGRYHWYLARQSEDLDDRFKHLKNAVRCDPSLETAWQQIVAIHFRNGERMEAWKTILESLSFNRTQPQGILFGREVWHSFSTVEERQEALRLMHETFADEFLPWLDRLVDANGPATVAVADTALPARRSVSITDLMTNQDAFDVVTKGVSDASSAPDINPDAWHSALAGETL